MTAPCVLGMATIRRREESLREVVDSLSGQAAHLYVYLNDYAQKSPWMVAVEAAAPVTFLLGCEHAGDLGDAAKFYTAPRHEQGYFISVDDDIVYPPNFVSVMCEWSARFGGAALCTTHGRRLGDTGVPIRGFFTNPHLDTRLFHGFSDVAAPEFVHFGGTGSMCFDLSRVRPPTEWEGRERNLADIWVGLHAQALGAPIIVVPHTKMWLRASAHVNVHKESIWAQTHMYDIPKYVINTSLTELRLHTCSEVR